MSIYKAKYYFGPRGAFDEVEVEIMPGELKISKADGNNIFWTLREIKAHPDNDNNKTYFSYSDNNGQSHLEILGQNFLSDLRSKSTSFSIIKPYKRYAGCYKFLALLGILLIGFWIFYAFILPKLVDKTASAIPYSWEQEMGVPIFKQIQLQEKIDSSRSILIDSFFQSLNWDSLFPSQVYFSNSEVVNAFALPGGKIIVYSGLIHKMESYTELVALLGHEYGHIEKRHVFRGMVQSLSTYAAVSLLLGDITAISAVFMEQANRIYNLKYSRAYETESDEFGFQKMKEKRIDPQGIITLFTRLKDSNDSSSVGSIPDFLSTHPGVEERILSMTKRIHSSPFPIKESKDLKNLFDRLKRIN
ncbi:MAG: M48 family metallopeptidase [Saprospiraceae bacterium]|nr:M48 family metallopeptidase [Saprospiraceae bacterium]